MFNMRKKPIIITYILLLLLSVFIFQSLIQGNKNFLMTQPLITSHKLITLNQPGFCIEGNVALAAKSSSGNGTEENPYIIEDLMINEGVIIYWGACCFGPQYRHVFGIYINNTDKFFVIRNCSIDLPYYPRYWDFAWMYWVYYEYYTGVYLNNVTNGFLSNITISFGGGFSKIGLSLYNSANNTIISNNLIDIYSGINLYCSNYNKIVNNTIERNSLGLWLAYSSNNSLINNTFTQNYYALRLSDFSDSNLISNNIFIFNTNWILEEDSQENIFQNNIIYNIPPLPLVPWLIPSIIGIGLLAIIIFTKKRRTPRN